MSLNFSNSSLWVFDGAIGTELYDKGHYIHRPFEELNINAPADVEAVHQSYVDAGAEILTSNTFAISTPQLKKFDIQNRQSELLEAGLSIVSKVAKKAGKYVGLSLGPIGELVEPLGSFGLAEARVEFSKIAQIACQWNFHDLYILETFTNISELDAAISGIRAVDSVRPLLASIAVHSSEKAVLGDFVIRIAARPDVQALGLNCSQGPSDLLTSLQKLRQLTSKPIIVQPNAGVPRHVNGRYFYMTSPDYLGKFAKRFIEAGAQGVGGCCGTGPAHIQSVYRALQMAKARSVAQINSGVVQAGALALDESKREIPKVSGSVPLDWKNRPHSQIGEYLSKNRKILSVEILPPRGTDLLPFLKKIETLKEAGVRFINVPDGARASTRVSSLHAAAAIKRAFPDGLGVIPHFTTRDRNLIALQSDLLGASINNVHDILIVTGDPPKLGTSKEATAVYDIDSIGLSYLTHCLNQGTAPNGEKLGQGTGFGIGVASNPTATQLETEIQRWKYKVESGADFAVTQPIFDPEMFLRWKEKISTHDRPHLVGIWPLISLRNAEFMANEIPGVFVPIWVLEEMAKAEGVPSEAVKRGVGLAQKVMRALEESCEGFCVSAPLGKIEIVLETLKI